MRKILLHTFSAILALTAVVSCKVDNPPLFYSYMTAVKEQPDQGVSYFVADDSTIIYPTEWFQGLSEMKHNQRLFATFTIPSGELGDRIEVSIRSYSLIQEDSIIVSSQPDTLGKDPVTVYEAWHSGGIHGAGRFVTLSFAIGGAGYYPHSVCLVDTTATDTPDADGYCHLTFRHDANNDPQAYLSQSAFTFPLTDKYTAPGVKGLKIRYIPNNTAAGQTITINYAD